MPVEEGEGMKEKNMDLEELEMDQELTSVQRMGKEAMKKKIEEGWRKKWDF